MQCIVLPHRSYCAKCASGTPHETLAAFLTRHGIKANPSDLYYPAARIVCLVDLVPDKLCDAYDLADYMVSSITGGSVWFRPRGTPSCHYCARVVTTSGYWAHFGTAPQPCATVRVCEECKSRAEQSHARLQPIDS